MAYQLFDPEGREVTQADLQNRAAWYDHGLTAEQVFVRRYGERLGAALNPEKRRSPTVPDLVFRGRLADLKCQNTPFFLADRYGVDPTYAVTFNLKDALAYGQWGHRYRDFHIIYWVDWVAVRMARGGRDSVVKPLSGVWAVEFRGWMCCAALRRSTGIISGSSARSLIRRASRPCGSSSRG